MFDRRFSLGREIPRSREFLPPPPLPPRGRETLPPPPPRGFSSSSLREYERSSDYMYSRRSPPTTSTSVGSRFGYAFQIINFETQFYSKSLTRLILLTVVYMKISVVTLSTIGGKFAHDYLIFKKSNTQVHITLVIK